MKKIYNKINNVILDAPMAEYTSFKAGGKAEALILPESREELMDVLQILNESRTPYMIMGNGSNILVKDGGYPGAIVKLGDGFSHIETSGEEITAGSGALLSAVARHAHQEGLTGMEFACGIPGSLGGGVFMNAGAYEGEMKNILRSVRLLSPDGREEITRQVSELEMGYRTSSLQRSGEIVLAATLKLSSGDKDKIGAKMRELMDRRNSKQPVDYPSGGSFFKRPVGHFAGKLIQDAGLSGFSVGGAQVSTLHAGFVINKGGATATDIIQLMHIVQARVMEKFQVKMEPEIRIIGEDLPEMTDV
ncbi:MAG: UDP-N-acetylmuramate dehydrogenase [Anaerovoracaceae bacterium]